MITNALNTIDKKIEFLIIDATPHTIEELKLKIETVLKEEETFKISQELDPKAVDMYLNRVINKRNQLKLQREEILIQKNQMAEKYALIEQICQKLEFESNEEVIKKVEELESKSLKELEELNQISQLNT